MSFDPNQPRVPAGSPAGGEWAGEGGSVKSMIESGAHQKNVQAYQEAVKHRNPYAPRPQAVAPGTHKAMADQAIARAERTLQQPTQPLKDSPQFHTPAARIAGMDTIGGTKVDSTIAAKGDLNLATQRILDVGKAGKTYHPDALLAVNKITDYERSKGL